MPRFEKLLALGLALVPSLAVAGGPATIHEITGLRNAGRASPFANLNLSADGSTVAGGGGIDSFRWTVDGGIEYLADLPDGSEFRNVIGVSADGSTLLGETAPRRWGLWHESGEVQLIDERLYDVAGLSDDASTVIGSTIDPGLGGRAAARWRLSDGLTPLESTPTTFSRPFAVSADGSRIAGARDLGDVVPNGFSWHDGMDELTEFAPLPTAEVIHSINAMSSNGRHFLGTSNVNGDSIGVILRDGAAPVTLSPSEGIRNIQLKAISNSGDLVFGQYFNSLTGYQAFVWDPEHGMRDLHDILSTEYGLADQLEDWTLREIRDVSADGRTIVGVATMPTPLGPNTLRSFPFVVTIPEPSTWALAILALPVAIYRLRRCNIRGVNPEKCPLC